MSKKKKHDKIYIKQFKNSFKNIKNVKLYFIKWNTKKLINYIIKNKIKGIILSGSSYRIFNKNISNINLKIFKLKIPILGICYGYQYIIKNIGDINFLNSHLNKKIHKYNKKLIINKPFKIYKNIYYFNHFDYIQKLPDNWISIIKNKDQIWMAYDKINKHIGIQFHPEKYKKSGRIFYKKWIKYII